jgi:hypothetical protein
VLPGEWRILRAKIRHVIDSACRLAARSTRDIQDYDAITALRTCALDYLDGRPQRLPASWLVAALDRLLDVDLPAVRTT